ncbi:MAG: hypothetical protein OEX07_05010, partial [Gammaproteobacteria bacterium]|nr:hypothetical protein [Gammaproteobacteria bacterium]
MLILPSGKIIDLSTDRAKYHALRDPGITSESAHRALYAVVDVVNRHKNIDDMPCRGWTEFDYHYSGYTIASIRLSENWSDEDKAAIFQWVQLPNQIRVIETARRRLTDNQNFFSIKEHSSPRHLYSLLKKRLCALSLQRTTAKQWQATISNFKKNGVREEEIQWSGLLHYFKTLPSDFVISKQTVIDRLNFENIRIELNTEREWGVTGGLNFNEVVKRMPHQAVYRAALKLDDSCSCILRYQDSCYNYRVGVVKTSHFAHKMALNRFWFALDPYG